MENAAWAKVEEDVRQSKEYGKYMEKIGWFVRSAANGQATINIFLRKLGPVKIAKIQRAKMPLPDDQIEEILKAERVMMCKLEPQEMGTSTKADLKNQRWKQDNWPLLGSKTLRVNLRPNSEEVFKSFKKDARYALRRVHNTGYKVQTNNFEDFYKIWQKANKIKNLYTPPKKDFEGLVASFGKKVFCVTLDKTGGCLMLLHKGVGYYYYSGTLPDGKKYDLPYAVVWEGMKEAQKRGAKIWDFEGIYDSRWPNKGWRGFTHFKKSFGGVEIEYPGCFTKWRWPF